MADKRMCPLCEEPLEEPPNIHYKTQCAFKELEKGREKIKRLTQSVADWKNAWFHLREIVGQLWWQHPAIDNDAQHAYYQENQRQLAAKNCLNEVSSSTSATPTQTERTT